MRNPFMGPLMDQATEVPGGNGNTGIDETKVNAMINGALASFAKDKLPNVVKEATTTAISGLSTQLAALTENLTKLQTPPPVDDKDKNKLGDDGLTPAARAQFQALQKAVDAANQKFATAEEARLKAEAASALDRRNAAIRAELGQYQYQSSEAAEDAFSAVNGKVELDADGNYVADGLLLKDFVTTFIPEKKSYLLAPVDKSGAGASQGRGRGTQSKVDLDDITVENMADPKKAQMAAQAIVSALGLKR
jgi:hypothetical protein